jgi:hypothetical protein
LEVESAKLEFLVERLCLPMSFTVALTLFEAAKIEMISAFTEEIAALEEQPASLLPFTNQGKLEALSALIIEVTKIEALSAFASTVKDRRPRQEKPIITASEESEESADEETDAPPP